MTPSRQSNEADVADPARPGPDDPVLTALRDVEAQYRASVELLQQRHRATLTRLAEARKDTQALRQEITAKEREFDAERTRAQRQIDTAAALAAALKDMHRSLFSTNVYDLI